MKTIIVTMAALTLSLAAYAQETDTVHIKQSDPTYNAVADDMKDYTEVKASEIPASLKKTLRDPEYKGWEKSKIYRNDASEYVLKVVDPKTRFTTSYYFDKEGKRKKD